MSKRRNRRKTSSTCHGAMATKERQRQNGGVVAEPIHEKSDGKTYINRHRAQVECILDAYLVRRKITEVEHEAGMKFRRAYLRAVLRVRVAEYGPGCHGDMEMAALVVIKSEQILREAYTALSPAQKAMIIHVCGQDHWAGDYYHLETLHRGLEKLIKLWKLA